MRGRSFLFAGYQIQPSRRSLWDRVPFESVRKMGDFDQYV